MISLVVVIVEKLLAVFGGLAGIIGSLLDGKCRNTGMCKREVIGPVILTLLGMSFWRKHDVHFVRSVANHRPHCSSIRARYFEIFGWAKWRKSVEIDIQRRFAERFCSELCSVLPWKNSPSPGSISQ